MKSLNKVLCAGLLAGLFCTIQADPITDIVQWNVGYFAPSASETYDSPYYRWAADDWGWQHSAIAIDPTTVNSATLSISAFDVDAGIASYMEFDEIFAYENSVNNYVSLGYLGGGNDIYSYTTFNLGSQFYDDIQNGLQVYMNIDKNNGGWAVTLAKSVISIDGGLLPDPNPDPNAVPEPHSISMILIGLGMISGFAIRKRNAK